MFLRSIVWNLPKVVTMSTQDTPKDASNDVLTIKAHLVECVVVLCRAESNAVHQGAEDGTSTGFVNTHNVFPRSRRPF